MRRQHRAHTRSAYVHVTAALNEVVALETLLKERRRIGDCVAHAIFQHVFGTELAGFLTAFLARRSIEVGGDIFIAYVAPKRSRSLAAGSVAIEHRQASAIKMHHLGG